MATSAVASTSNDLLTNGSKTKSKDEAGSADRFLKLLVAQMQNQDPLNPMDNAQVTSQMAQINTVNGIEKLNTTVDGLNGQFVQMQTMTGASLVGRTITLQGDKMSIEGGEGVGGFDLSGTADRVKIEVLSPGGRVVETLDAIAARDREILVLATFLDRRHPGLIEIPGDQQRGAPNPEARYHRREVGGRARDRRSLPR